MPEEKEIKAYAVVRTRTNNVVVDPYEDNLEIYKSKLDATGVLEYYRDSEEEVKGLAVKRVRILVSND